MPLVKLITCASLRVTGQALMLKDSGLKMDFAAYVGISMALKAVALALTGRDDAGLNALWAWSGLDEVETPANWQTPLNRAELPLDLLGIDELDESDGSDDLLDA